MLPQFSYPVIVNRLDEVREQLLRFRDERDWKQFHSAKNLALALSIEAAELNELYLWKETNEQVNKERVAEELADVMAYVLYLADHYHLDLPTIVAKKIEQNRLKYPVESSKGNATKYNAR